MSDKARRRPKGDGAIYQDGAGRWRGYVQVPGRNGKRTRQYFSGRSKQEVAAKVRAATRQIEKGLPIPDAHITLAAVGERWLADGLRHDLATNTKAEKRAQVTFITKRIGGVRAVDLTPSDCASLVNEMLADGRSNSYAGRMRSTLCQMFDFAEAEGIVARNVARLSPTVSFTPKERERLTAQQAAAFLLAARKDTLLGAAVVVMMTLGLRPGEAMGFLWEDIDLDDRIAHLRRSLLHRPDPVTGKKVLTLGPTKTRQSIRSIRLPEITVRELRRHKVAQDERRLAAGPHWRDGHGMVFTTTIGTPVDPANLRRAVRDIRAAAGITKEVVPYDFRRSAASILSAADVPGEQIADVLGNDPKLALSTYRRRMEPIVEVAVAPMDDLFGTV